MRIVSTWETQGSKAIAALVNRGSVHLSLEPVVRKIIADVRQNGDSALRKYSAKWDGFEEKQSLRVSLREMNAALKSVKKDQPDFIAALELAANNIRKFCEWQKPKEWLRTLQPGVRVGQIVRPLERVGCYVPGGRYPLPSTLLMTVIPAQVAGVREIEVVSPRPARETLAAAALLGVKTFYCIGGAQAIAALAYGTRSVSRVDKIVGPGNSFVTTAKKLVAFDCAIDMLAGPTEALIVSHAGNPTFIAADLVAQAEHDPETSVAFVTTSAKLAKEVVDECTRLASGNAIAMESLKRNGLVIVTRKRSEAIDVANAIASEHTTVEHEDVPNIKSAGSIFVGNYSAQPLGDYASGPNHVLPTGGAARFRGGLSVSDFLKVISGQEISRVGLRKLGPSVVRLAEAEGLKAHAEAVRVRMGVNRA
ncbi:MAG: histidinol dehydrogenase [Acidobacteriaceae bacterium]|nr:histidinol dehydrogenase [Acidobacteriaceae bacterium]